MYQRPASPSRRTQNTEEDRSRIHPGSSPSHPSSNSPRLNRPTSPRLHDGTSYANAMPLPPYPSSQAGHSPSPQMNGTSSHVPSQHAPSPTPSTRYDPLADHRDLNGSRKRTLSQTNSPVQSRTSLTPYASHAPDMSPSPQSYRSPTQSSFPQHSPVPRHASTILAPEPFTKPHLSAPRSSTELNGYHHDAIPKSSVASLPQKASAQEATPVAEPKRADPMSFSNILSGDVAEAPRPSTRGSTNLSSTRKDRPDTNGDSHTPQTAPRKSAAKATPPQTISAKSAHVSTEPGAAAVPTKTTANNKRKPLFSAKENEKVLKEIARIDASELSDLENMDFDRVRDGHLQFTQAREQALFKAEQSKRKRRRTAAARNLSIQIGALADHGKERFWSSYEPQAMEQVQQKEQHDEKERKKDMQRKRRRERTLQQQEQALEEASEKMRTAADDAEREKFFQQAQRAEKKARHTKRILEGRDESPEGIREVTPMALNMEGGTMGTFQTAVSPEPPRKKPRTGGSSRPKKSKEKKDQEKASAEAGFAAGYHMLGSNDHVNIAPKEGSYDYVRETRQSQAMKDASPSSHATTNFNSKGYQQMFEQIWKDIAKKDIPKVYRIKESSLATKQSNLRKTVQLASKEARRWQLRTNKGTKDVQARAKRSMREMMSFWKRNERAERDLRKNAEKQELELARKAEADRESNRQKRKLNFLIEQTELYAHFIGNKIKTDEVEKSTDPDVGVSSETVQPGKPDAHTITLPTSSGKAKVTGFDQLDFDAEDETALKEAAMANAQNAVEEAQARAKAFNSGGQDLQSQFDDGEMNFQNPTGMGDINIAQPKMLAAQLKEYQLKGLNWLVNLYEQGINGILADEMGLGKTVQSISVMGYLAEKYNIWGPFLVVAPASTLHNWQQEIARFLPGLKCLPYWGNNRDRKILRKFWDRKSITYNKDSPFHVLVTSYQLVVVDMPYFQKMRWQYMILDEAQAIKSSNSSRWKCLLGFHCRNRLLLTGTPIQNNMQELWALLHFIMPSLFDSHDEFSEWFSKDIENHAQTNTKLNEDQLKRLHMILKPFMLRRIKKNVQKELGDKVEKDVFCDLTYRQRAYYTNLRNKISVMDLIEKAAIGDDQDTATLMNLVMQFRKVCNHPDLFERADISSPFSLVHFAETASFLREGPSINVDYSTKNAIDYDLPRLLCKEGARLDIAGPQNPQAGTKNRYLRELMNIWTPENVTRTTAGAGAFSWLRFADASAGEVRHASHSGLAHRAIELAGRSNRLAKMSVLYDGDDGNTYSPTHALFNIAQRSARQPLADVTSDGHLKSLLNISRKAFDDQGLGLLEKCAQPGANAPPIQISCSDQDSRVEKENVLFNVPIRKALYGFSEMDEAALLEAQVPFRAFPTRSLLPEPLSQTARFTDIEVPSMRRFVTDSGKLAKLDELLRELKEGGHRVLLYFQMTRMIDLMEEYLTFRNYKYLRLDGSTKIEDRRDTVADFQTKPENFVFLLSTRAGGLGINLTAADTVIFYDSDWNPTIDSQAMDRAHRLGQTRQVTVYRMITSGTIEERIRKRALQKEEVQRVVISGQSGTGVDFNTRSKENRTKDIALWLADDEQAELIEKKEAEVAARGEEKRGRKKGSTKKKEISLDDMYHEGEGHFEAESSNKPSGAATPIDGGESNAGAKKKGNSKRAKTIKQRLAVADGSGM